VAWKSRLGILHGDLKPSNLFLCPVAGGGTRVVVTDFGLARLANRAPHEWTRTGQRLGTPAYMAPELFYSGELTFAADIYSFGITILEMTTGCRDPLVASRKMPAGLGPAWNAVLKKCLDPDPENRFASPLDVIENLENPEAWWRNDWQSFPGKGPLRWVLICAFFAVIALLFWAEWPRIRQFDTDRAPSIAVLPFTNLRGAPKDQYLADGLPEELANKLTKMEGLRVAAASSTLRFRGATDLRETAEKLHVRMLLTGSVRVSEDRIRVTTALVRAGDETQVWSEIYERPAEGYV
jgi:TolB-like protein